MFVLVSYASIHVQLSNSQKRARTRITDEQLKILRAHFDINNSPSEESIMEMSQKAQLPIKVRTFTDYCTNMHGFITIADCLL